VNENRKYPFPEIDPDICKGCKLCIAACPKDVLVISEKLNSKGFHYSEYVGEGCIGCGNCYYTCPEPSAVTVYLKNYVPEEVS
jgi:NAD-dependent dihydropyrimidine dehydrogenase PreA subunit